MLIGNDLQSSMETCLLSIASTTLKKTYPKHSELPSDTEGFQEDDDRSATATDSSLWLIHVDPNKSKR